MRVGAQAPTSDMTSSGIDPAARRPDAFLSYSRRDRGAADLLVAQLTERGKDVWVDMQDIPAASRWRDELARAIEVSDAVIALVSPAWVASENCRQELEHADGAGKRIVPVLAAPTDSVPDALSSRQWVELGTGADWTRAIDQIVAAIETDLPYVRAHARYLEESQRWGAAGRDRGFLLRGGELRAAEAWLATRSEHREPRPTADQIAFVQESRSDATRRLRILTVSALAATAAVIVLGVLALIQRNVAVDRQHTSRSRELAALSEVRRASDPEAAVRLAVQGLEERDTAEAQIGLRRAIAASPVIARFGGPGDEVDDAAITTDGATVVTARRDGVVRAFDTATGRSRWTWTGTAGFQVVVLQAGDGAVAVGQGSGAVALLDVSTGTPITALRTDAPGTITAAVPSPDGASILGLTTDLTTLRGVLKLWDRDTGRLIGDLSAGAAEFPQRPVYTPDGALVVVPYRGGGVRVWDARTGRLVRVLPGRPGPVNRVDIDTRGRRVAAAYEGGGVRVWDLATGRLLWTGRAGTQAINAVRFSPDGTKLAAVGRDAVVRVWDARSGTRLASLAGHEAGVGRVQWIDAQTIVTGGDDGTARVWDLARRRRSAILLGHGLSVNVTPGAAAAHVLTIGAEGTARVWRLAQTGTTRIGEAGATARISVAEDGQRLLTEGSPRLEVALWRLAPGAAPERLLADTRAIAGAIAADGSLVALAGSGLRLFDGDGAPVGELHGTSPYSNVAVVADGSRVAATRLDGGTDIWDPARGATVARVGAEGRILLGELVVSRSGAAVASSSVGKPITVADAQTGAAIGSVPPPESIGLPAFAIDPAGRRVFRLDYGVPEKPAITDAATGARVTLGGDTPSSLDAASFSSDGSELLTAGGGAAQLWDAGDGGLIGEYGKDRSRTSTAAFSPDDRLIVTGHDDGLVRVWDRTTQAQLGEFDAGLGPVRQVETAFGGTRILAVGEDRTLRMFTCDACAPAEELLGLAGRHVAFGDADDGS